MHKHKGKFAQRPQGVVDLVFRFFPVQTDTVRMGDHHPHEITNSNFTVEMAGGAAHADRLMRIICDK